MNRLLQVILFSFSSHCHSMNLLRKEGKKNRNIHLQHYCSSSLPFTRRLKKGQVYVDDALNGEKSAHTTGSIRSYGSYSVLGTTKEHRILLLAGYLCENYLVENRIVHSGSNGQERDYRYRTYFQFTVLVGKSSVFDSHNNLVLSLTLHAICSSPKAMEG